MKTNFSTALRSGPGSLGLEMLLVTQGSNTVAVRACFEYTNRSPCLLFMNRAQNAGHAGNEHASAPVASAPRNRLLLQHPHTRPVRDLMLVMLCCGKHTLELPFGVQPDGTGHHHPPDIQHHTGKQ
jgi:hypothetical protein